MTRDSISSPARGTTERATTVTMLGGLTDGVRIMVGVDKNFDIRTFVRSSRQMGVTPHMVHCPTTGRRSSSIDGRTTRPPGYAISRRKRKLVEQAFGWMKRSASANRIIAVVRWSTDLYLPFGGLQPDPAAPIAGPTRSDTGRTQRIRTLQ